MNKIFRLKWKMYAKKGKINYLLKNLLLGETLFEICIESFEYLVINNKNILKIKIQMLYNYYHYYL